MVLNEEEGAALELRFCKIVMIFIVFFHCPVLQLIFDFIGNFFLGVVEILICGTLLDKNIQKRILKILIGIKRWFFNAVVTEKKTHHSKILILLLPQLYGKPKMHACAKQALSDTEPDLLKLEYRSLKYTSVLIPT